MNYKFFLVGLLSFIFIQLKSQVITIDTVYQSNNPINNLSFKDGYYYWFEMINDKPIYFRKHNGIIESRTLPENFSSCNWPFSIYTYNDFIYLNFVGCGPQNQGFLWGSNDVLIEDTLDIGFSCAGFNNFILNQQGHIINIETGTKTILSLEDANYRYELSNNCGIGDSIVSVKAFKYEISNNNYIGDAIIQYNLKTNERQEIFLSPQSLHFSEFTPIDESISFTQQHPSFNFDSVRIHYYDKEKINLVTQRDILTQSLYLNGVAYSSADSIFYWEEEFTTLIGNGSYDIKTDKCRLAWFSGYSENTILHFFDGSNYSDLPINGNIDQNSTTFTSDNSFVFRSSDINDATYYILKVNHGIICSSNCENLNLQIPESDGKSYIRAKNIVSRAKIDKGNTMYKAAESIQLLPGFSVGNDFDFIAKIEDCDNPSFLKKEKNEILESLENKTENLAIFSKNIQKSEIGLLDQNFPNPFYSQSKIKYILQKDMEYARILIFDSLGRIEKNIKIEEGGRGEIEIQIQIDEFSTGLYYYSLEVNGQIVDTKKMSLIK